MIFFFGGTDRDKAIKKSSAFLVALQKKRPDAEVLRVSELNWTPAVFEELVQSQGLFEQKVIVVAKDLFENKENALWIVENIESLKDSTNAFLFSDGALDAKTKKVIEKASQTFEYSELAKENPFAKKDRGNAFALSDAVGARNARRAWSLFCEIKDDLAPEEIHGTLWWQLKSMYTAGVSKSIEESKLNPFVYKKSISFAKNYSKEELGDLFTKFIKMYHDAHRGQVDLTDEIEKAIIAL